MKLALPFNISLFWRNFAGLLLLLLISFALWSQGFALWQQYPRSQALAGQLITAVNVTRNALVYANPKQRDALLAALNKDERVGVVLRETNDTTVPLDSNRAMEWLTHSVQEGLGNDTELALKVNGELGLWVSFNIGGKELGVDSYWMRFDRNRLEPRSSNPTRWWLWMGFALIVAFVGAVGITRRLTQPLSALARSLQTVAEFKPYAVLPESGVKEIAQVNAGMNRMVQALATQDTERSFMLASLSHDLRTPLARLRLEAEMAGLSPSTHNAMVSDIEQIDAQLTQLTDFVASNHPQFSEFALDGLVRDVLLALERDTTVRAVSDLSALTIQGDARLLARALGNALENASRYGRSTDGLLHLNVQLNKQDAWAALRITDTGNGVSTHSLAGLLKPFTRGDVSRSGAQGSGLGLAIVDRVVQQHGGSLQLVSAQGQGFGMLIQLPLERGTL